MFVLRNLSVLAYANGFSLWHYKTSQDTCLEVKGPGYFADAGHELSNGDMILVSAKDGGTAVYVEHMVPRVTATAPLIDGLPT